MPLRPDMEIHDYVELILRRKWLIIFSFLFTLLGAGIYCVVTPERYLSSTTILVVPQKVPEGYVRQTITTGVESRLATINQQVMSRTRIEAVMDELNLFPDLRKKIPLEDLVENMRKRIQIKVSRSDAFTLSFSHENPRIAMLTVSRLASFFIDENLKAREQQAQGTSEFLESQLQQMKGMLEEKEKRLGEYKTKNMGELPQQLDTNLRLLSQFQERGKAIQESIRYAEDRKEVTEFQIQSLEGNLSGQKTFGSNNETGSDNIMGSVENPAFDPYREDTNKLLYSKKQELALLTQKYTESHPQIKRLKQEISSIERANSQNNPIKLNTVSGGIGNKIEDKKGIESNMPKAERQIELLREKVQGLNIEITALKRERDEIQTNIAAFQRKVENVPKKEQDLIELTRDYDNLRRSYDDILKKKLDADIANNLEKRQKGEQFQILDPANVPSRPFVPNRPLAFGVALVLSFLIGFGGAIVLELVNTSVRSVKEFRHFVPDVPVIAAIPVIQDNVYHRRKKIRQFAILGGLISFTVILTLFLAVYGHKIRTVLQEII